MVLARLRCSEQPASSRTQHALGQHVVLVVVLAPVEARDHNVHTRVVQRREERCRDREHRDAERVKADGARDDGDREQVYVLAHEVLEGVLVDGILDAVSRDVLLVMVLVDPGIPAWLAQAMRARARATQDTGQAGQLLLLLETGWALWKSRKY